MKMRFLIIITFFLAKLPEAKVYICNGPNATKYHKKASCRGLSNCQYKLAQVSLETARKSKKVLCSWEK